MSNLVIRPKISEKAYALSLTKNVYIFEVPAEANKLTVASEVAKQFNVTVEQVRIAVHKGKVKRSYSKRGGWIKGERSDVKRAYVTLKDGDSLPFFAAEEQEPAKAVTDTKETSTKRTRGRSK
jgi:large subunit ribosomal protein L23